MILIRAACQLLLVNAVLATMPIIVLIGTANGTLPFRTAEFLFSLILLFTATVVSIVLVVETINNIKN